MRKETELEKLERLNEIIGAFSPGILDLFESVSEKADEVFKEDIVCLANAMYKEGVMDGMRFYDWLVEEVC